MWNFILVIRICSLNRDFTLNQDSLNRDFTVLKLKDMWMSVSLPMSIRRLNNFVAIANSLVEWRADNVGHQWSTLHNEPNNERHPVMWLFLTGKTYAFLWAFPFNSIHWTDLFNQKAEWGEENKLVARTHTCIYTVLQSEKESFQTSLPSNWMSKWKSRFTLRKE